MGRRLVCAILLAGGAVAAAAPEAALPFVDAQGRVTRAPTYAELVRELGEPPESTVRTERWESPPRGRSRGGFGDERWVKAGGEHDLSYPALGLTFTIARDDRPLRDPPVRWMRIAAPSTARLPPGLYIGQPMAEAAALARRHFDVEVEALYGRTGGFDLRDATPHRLSLGFTDGALHSITFDFKPPPTLAQRRLMALGAIVVVAVAAAAFARWRRRVVVVWPVPGARTTQRVGAVIAWGGLALAGAALLGLVAAAYTGVTGQNAAAAMVAFLLGQYALTALLGGAVLVAIGRRIASEA